jgi:MFS family permease
VQGAVISPLLSNIYLNGLDWKMAQNGMEMVRYADDFVVLCTNQQQAQEALEQISQWVEENGLKLHPSTTYLLLASGAGLLAVFAWLHLVHPYVILATVFLLGTGFAFNAPVWACVVPEIVRKEQIASAVTLGGVQMNLAGIVGPALGSLLLPIAGSAFVFSPQCGDILSRSLDGVPSLSPAKAAGSAFGKLSRVVCQRVALCAVHTRHAGYSDARLLIRAIHRGGPGADAGCCFAAFTACG